ncbi:MAG: hypothetical protein ACP5NV_03775 [Candidatus Woesearchaeota archaeon]
MNIRFKRKLYARGGSYETTIPVQMLFSSDLSKKNNVIFEYDKKTQRWIVSIEENQSSVDNQVGNQKNDARKNYVHKMSRGKK